MDKIGSADGKLELRAIYADDEEALHQFVPMFLKLAFPEYKVNTKSVRDGCALVDEMRLGQYQFVVTDNIMPRLNGSDALQMLQKENSRYKIPGIIITGLALLEIKEKIEDLEYITLLEKPFTMERFIEEVRNAWGNYQKAIKQSF